jgi:septal ring-binding cell division protein DamX
LNGGGQGNSKVEEENNAAFDRICSLLTHLITDASTAVSTAPDGSQQPSNIPLPQFSPLISSESESSTHSDASDDDDQDEADQDSSTFKPIDGGKNTANPQDEFIKRLQGPEGVPPLEELELEIEDPKPSIRYRKGLRSRYNQPTKRLSSLFMELSNTQRTGDSLQDELTSPKISSETKNLDTELTAKEKPTRKPRHSVSSLSISSTRSSRPSSMYNNTRQADPADPQVNFDGQPLSPMSVHVPRHRASTSSMRSSSSSSRSDSLHTDLEVQQVFQGVNSELDRTVETIDGLTRDLVAVATHQNWMQMKLQKTLHFQKQQVEKIDLAHSNSTAHRTLPAPTHSASRELNQRHNQTTTLSSDPTEQHHPLADLSRSLKQVAVSVGKVLANSTPSTPPRNRLVESLHGPSEGSEDSTTTVRGGRSTPTQANRKEFTRYFQELEKVAAIGGKIGFDKTDVDGFDTRELLGESLDHHQEKHYLSDSHQSDSDHQRESTTSSRGQGQNSSYHSRRGSGASTGGPPELEDFAAQCRLLTRALVLPFVQLTHHAMTSQDSALALTPRTSRFTDQSSVYDNATLENIEDLDVTSGTKHTKHSSSTSSTGTRRSSLVSSSHHVSTPRNQKKSHSPLSSPLLPAAWSSSLSLNGRDLDSILKDHSELSPDAIVKARSVISTGLYLIHLLYWTVLFVIGTIVLDPWLAETAGQQVVRIVEQVRDAVAKDGLIGQGIHHAIDQGHHQLRQRHSFEQQRRRVSSATTDSDLIDDQLSLDQDHLRRSTFSSHQQNSNRWDAVDDEVVPAPDSSRRPQDLEDRAIEVAVGFESLKQRLGSSPGSVCSSRSSFRPLSGLWSRPNSFQSTASALTEATMGDRTQSPDSPLTRSNSQGKERPLSQISAASSTMTEGSVLRTISWAGPRRRRATRDGNSGTQARVRRYSNNARGVNVPFKVGGGGGEFAMPTLTPRQGLNVRRDRPQTHWGTFESTSVFASSDNSGFGLGHSRGTFREASSSISSTASSSTTLSEFILPPYNSTSDMSKVNLALAGGSAAGLAAKAFNWVQTGAVTAAAGVESVVRSQGRRRSF